MVKRIFSFCAFASVTTVSAMALEVTFVGSSYEVIRETPERNTGLDALYVVYDASQLSEMRFEGVGSSATVWKYSNLGGGYAQNVDFTMDGTTAVVANPEGDMGYFVTVDGRSEYMWLVNYLPHKLTITSVAASPEQDCDNTSLEVTGSGAVIHYYSIDGRQCELSRDIEVTYNTLEWSQDDENYRQSEAVKTLSHLTSPVVITPPIYCNTTFDITGDRFLEYWKLGVHVESGLVYANGISVETTATQTNLPDDSADADASNMIKAETGDIGGSAPADISFRAFTTDAVIHNEWQIAADESFEYIDYRFNEQNLDYTFTDEGTYYVRFVGSNADGSCETYGETYTIGIGSSELKIPNAFTPNGDGVNDVWKVSYRSLLTFSCTIFDRYGQQLYHFTDPTQGWDGKYKGKLVKPGVYFYVIEAKGADGHKYKKGGDINIINSKRYDSTTANPAASRKK